MMEEEEARARKLESEKKIIAWEKDIKKRLNDEKKMKK
jgi:hypothetical protein